MKCLFRLDLKILKDARNGVYSSRHLKGLAINGTQSLHIKLPKINVFGSFHVMMYFLLVFLRVFSAGTRFYETLGKTFIPGP